MKKYQNKHPFFSLNLQLLLSAISSRMAVSFCFTCLIIMLSCQYSFAQAADKKTLQKKYESLQNEIKDTEDLLSDTKKKKQNSLNEVKLIKRKIDVREEMIATISQQMKAVVKEMQEAQENIAVRQKELDKLKDEYAKMIYYAYVNESDYQPLHFILASKSLGDAIHEIEYVRAYTAYRKEQLSAIATTQTELLAKINELAADKIEKENLLNKEQDQKNTLLTEKTEKDATLKNFSGQEKELSGKINKKKKDAADLNNQIQNIIADEIRKEKEKAEAEAKKKKEAADKALADKKAADKAAADKAAAEKKTAAEKSAAEKAVAEKTTTEKTTTEKTVTDKSAADKSVATTTEKKAETAAEKKTTTADLNLTPESQLASKNFEGNKGKLPWPVERGSITERFGTHEHAVLSGVMVQNNGIDISTSDGAGVRSIFEGEVVNVIFNPAFQKGVIIKHGNYYTVYTQLESVSVKAGDKISTRQRIGTAYTDNDEGKTEVHLEIWKGTVLLDPALWISKQ